MYVSWNNFTVGVGALQVTFSTDNGATWHAAINVSNTNTFIRDVQITGDLSGNGTTYIAGMDEGGGGFRTTTPIRFSGPRTAALRGLIRSPAPRSRGRAWRFAATTRTSAACLITRVGRSRPSGGTRVGVKSLPSTTLFTWTMPKRAPVPILAMFFTFAPLTAA